jgi:hypothetical protein
MNNIRFYKHNNRWPPKIGAVITIKSNNIEYIARVEKLISNNTAAICVLITNTDYVEKYLELNHNINGKGLFLLIPSYKWGYIDTNIPQVINISGLSNLDNIVDSEVPDTILIDNIDNIDSIVKNSYDKFIVHAQNIDINEFGTITDRPRVEGLSDSIYKVANTKRPSIINNNNHNSNSNSLRKTEDFSSLQSPIAERLSVDNITGIMDTNLLTENGEPDLNYLFMDNQYNETYESEPSNCEAPLPESQERLKIKLDAYEELNVDEIGIATSKVATYDNIINSKNDEMWEGKRIITWIEERLNKDYNEYMGGSVLKMTIKNGYVNVYRTGCSPEDIITEELVGTDTLHYFSWQIGRPIDYDTLKYTIFRNRTQEELVQDQQQLEEAKLILSQEYLIALNPEPKYQMWCLKRLLLCWFADDELLKNIRKIKILINQYRSLGDKEYNKIHGILPSIVVFPKYGVDSAQTVIRVLSDYFVFYKGLVGWENSNPTYFRQIDQLLYYTNGLMDLKLYYLNVSAKSNGTVINNVFNDKFTNIENFDDPFNKIK